MSELDYQIFDCDTHSYEPRDAFTRYLPKEFHDRAITPVRNAHGQRGRSSPATASQPSTVSRASGSTMPTGRARSRRCSSRWRPATRTRRTTPSRCALSTSSVSPACACSSSRASSVRPVPGRAWRSPPSTTSPTPRRSTPTSLVQPLVRRDVGLQLRRPALRDGAALAARPRPGGGGDRRHPRSRCPRRAAPDRPGLRPFARRPVLRPGVVAARRGRGDGRLPHHAVLVLRRHLPGVGARPRPGLVAHVGVAVEQRLRRAPDRGHALGADLRQPVRPVPEPEGAWSPSTAPSGCRTSYATWTRAAAWAATGRGSAAPLTERPTEIFRRHVRVAPYPEDDIPWIVENLGDDDSIVMGSDFPHAEGLAEPADFEKLLDPLDADHQGPDHAHQRRDAVRAMSERVFERCESALRSFGHWCPVDTAPGKHLHELTAHQ